MKNETSCIIVYIDWYVLKVQLFEKEFISQSSFGENCCSSTSWNGNSSERKALNSEVAQSHFWGFMTFNSIKPLRRSFHHSCSFSLGMLERWDGSKMLEQRRIVDPRGHFSKSFCNIPLINSWAPCVNFFTPSHDTLSDWTNFLIAPLTAKPRFIIFRGNKLS